MATGEEKMPLPPDIRATASEAAIEWDNVGKEIGLTDIASAKVTDIPGWEGEAQAAYRDSAEKLKAHTQTLIGIFPEIKKALDTWSEAVGTAISTTVPGFWVEYDAATTTYNSGIDAINDDIRQANNAGSPIPDSEVSRREVALRNTREDEYNRVLGEYKKAMEALDQVAQDSAGIIDGKVASLVNPDVANKGRDAIGADLFNDIPLIDGQAEWTLIQPQAAAAANIINDPNFTPEKLKEFEEKYGELCGNPFFATALGNRVSPEQMLQFIMKANVGKGQLVDPKTGKIDTLYDDAVENLVDSLGSVLVLSTGGMNADPSMAALQKSFDAARMGMVSQDGVSAADSIRNRINEIKEVGNTYYDAFGNPVGDDRQHGGGGFGEHYGYEYIAHMLGCAAEDNPNLALGREFIDGKDSVAQDIVRWDHQHLAEMTAMGTYGDWGLSRELPGGSIPGSSYTLDPITSMMMLMDEPEALADVNSEAYKLLGDENAARLDSVRDFLLSDSPLEGKELEGVKYGGDVSIARYLTGHRLTDTLFSGSTDQGEALGKVLAQASSTTPMPTQDQNSPEFAEWAEKNKKSTEIAAGFLVGYQEGLDFSDSTYHGEDTFGMANSHLRSWAGTILAPHLEGIAESLQNPSDGDDPFRMRVPDGNNPYGMKLNSDVVNALISKDGLFIDLAFDEAIPDKTPDDPTDDLTWAGRPPAIQTLLRAAGEGYAQDLSTSLGDPNLQGNGNYLASARLAQEKWAYLLNDLTVAPAGADTLQAEALDKSNKAFKDLVSKGAGMIPFSKLLPDGAETANWLVSQAKGLGLPWALDNAFATDNAAKVAGEALDAHNGVEAYMRQATYSALADANYWGNDPAQQPSAWIDAHHKAVDFTDGNGNVKPYNEMTPDQQSSFEDFVETESGHAYTYQKELLNTINPVLNDAQTERSEAR